MLVSILTKIQHLTHIHISMAGKNLNNEKKLKMNGGTLMEKQKEGNKLYTLYT